MVLINYLRYENQKLKTFENYLSRRIVRRKRKSNYVHNHFDFLKFEKIKNNFRMLKSSWLSDGNVTNEL